jgi:hypothetical protein
MLKFLEERFGNQPPKAGTSTELGKVISIDNELVRLKELGLLDETVNNQSSIDDILRAVIHSYEGIRMKNKGKEICSSSDTLSEIVESVVSPKGTEIGSTSYSKPKGEEGKAKGDGKISAIRIDKAESKSKGKAKGICLYCKGSGHGWNNCPEYLLRYAGKGFSLSLLYSCLVNPTETFLVCGFGI